MLITLSPFFHYYTLFLISKFWLIIWFAELGRQGAFQEEYKGFPCALLCLIITVYCLYKYKLPLNLNYKLTIVLDISPWNFVDIALFSSDTKSHFGRSEANLIFHLLLTCYLAVCMKMSSVIFEIQLTRTCLSVYHFVSIFYRSCMTFYNIKITFSFHRKIFTTVSVNIFWLFYLLNIQEQQQHSYLWRSVFVLSFLSS